MTTKNTKLPAKRDVKFILAEDIRSEGAGRFSLLGIFAGERFAVGGPHPESMKNVAFVLPSLAFVFIISEGSGSFPGRLRIIAPDKKTVVADAPLSEPIEMRSGLPSVVANAAKPFIGPTFGIYTVQLEIGKAKIKFPMTIDKAPELKTK